MRVERAVVNEENNLRLRIRVEEQEMEREKLKKKLNQKLNNFCRD